jgi:phosphatidylinositol alpha-1,6-mannosyltransferase
MLTSKIVANSNYTKELLKETLDIHEEKIKVIHPGIDVYDKFIQQVTTDKIFNIIKGRSPVILTLARLENRKGHKIVLQALAKLISEYPNLLYIIAGDGPAKQDIKKIVSELNLNNRTSFFGMDK